MSDFDAAQVEKGPIVTTSSDVADFAIVEDIKAQELRQIGFLRTLNRAEEWLDAKLGVETQGIDRIPEEEKRPPSTWNIFLLWWSLNVQVANIPVGMLGPQFGLSLRQSVAASVIGVLLGSACMSYTGTLGPKLGLRQLAVARYSFGFWGAKLCSVLNVVISGGFLVVNYVAAGQILSAISDYTMSITVGIVIVAVVSYLVSVFGFRVIHSFEKYSWIPTTIVLCVLMGQISPYVKTTDAAPSTTASLVQTGAFLTILALNFAIGSGWCSITSDYYCNYPANTSPWKIFFLTLAGNSTSLVFVITIGACVGAAVQTLTPSNHTLYHAYDNHGVGGLLLISFHPDGWAKFALLVFTFSVLGANIVTLYSAGLSMQFLGHYFHAVPRFLLSLVLAIAVTALSIAGRESLSVIVLDFVSLLAYWTVSFTFILLLEDRWFRRREGYNLLAWDDPAQLPWGAAAVTALLAGYLGGGVPGMAQTWYKGPVSLQFGPEGGDCGVYMSAAITLLVYPILRSIERRMTGR